MNYLRLADEIESKGWSSGLPLLAASAIREQDSEIERLRGLIWSYRAGGGPDVPNEVIRLQEELERKNDALDQALRQWRMYANDDRQFDDGDIATADDEEAKLYRAGLIALSPTPEEEES